MTVTIEPTQLRHIVDVLAEIEASDGVRILYAAESGSRAWGFASPDSDYDVRFIYARPLADYLSLSAPRDVIERPLDARIVDLGGWDVRKALQLLLRSNPTLHEWLSSPLVYRDDAVFAPQAKSLFERHASPRALTYHYHRVAARTWHDHFAAVNEVKIKRYFYVIRPLLAARWVIERHTPPPMAIQDLMAGLDLSAAPLATIEALIERKRHVPELGLEDRIGDLDAWIESELLSRDPDALELPTREDGHADAADRLFRSTIGLNPAST